MSNVRFIADLHFGHENMAKVRGFQDAFHQDEYIVKQWNSVVHKKDLVYILGDVTFETNAYDILDRLKGRKIVVMGNHDMRRHCKDLLNYVDEIVGCLRYKKHWLTHIPVHPRELQFRVKGNIHGHIHGESILLENGKKDERYICVSCEHVGYKPMKIEF